MHCTTVTERVRRTGHLLRIPGLQHALIAFCCAFTAHALEAHDTQKYYRRQKAHAGGGTNEGLPCCSRPISDYTYRIKQRF